MTTTSITEGHKVRVYESQRGSGNYTWKCECGQQGAPDYIHKAYARDGWREAHGLEPQINYPLV